MPAEGSELPPTFTARTAREFGLHPRDLYRLRDEGDLIELSRGVFRQADASVPQWADLLAVAYRAPIGIVCCISALAVHDLTDEIPSAVQIAVPRSNRPPRIGHPPTEVFRFSDATFELGLSTVEAAPGESVRIYSCERTVVDLMRLRHRLGESLALGALQRYLRRRNPRPGELLAIARVLGVFGPVRAALDVASAG
jgi:predicted transcriptional regulator of viral defense system